MDLLTFACKLNYRRVSALNSKILNRLIKLECSLENLVQFHTIYHGTVGNDMFHPFCNIIRFLREIIRRRWPPVSQQLRIHVLINLRLDSIPNASFKRFASSHFWFDIMSIWSNPGLDRAAVIGTWKCFECDLLCKLDIESKE